MLHISDLNEKAYYCLNRDCNSDLDIVGPWWHTAICPGCGKGMRYLTQEEAIRLVYVR